MVFFREFLAYSDENVQVYDKWVPGEFTNKQSLWVSLYSRPLLIFYAKCFLTDFH